VATETEEIFVGFSLRGGVGSLGRPTGIAVGRLPGRKSYALFASWSGAFRPLAYFRSDEDARIAVETLNRLAEATLADGDDD
jgi:hypothetical protein